MYIHCIQHKQQDHFGDGTPLQTVDKTTYLGTDIEKQVDT